ncbi:MAG TPA: hypothetical protein VLF93_02175 [Candidatus Saccharimonadales bacterium]|nr:hypothetical protein [Candidatus Saccharimonadales bacterium]
MSAEAPVQSKKKLDVRVVTNNRKDRPAVQQTETLVGKEGVLRLGVPVEVTGLGLLSGEGLKTNATNGYRVSMKETCGISCTTCLETCDSCRPCGR